jgi:CheY-like chemotaxis protein
MGNGMDGKTRVLVIDDEAALRETVKELLEAEGLAVRTASGGFEALALLQDDPLPHVILLDLMMGLMSGWELRRRLTADGRLAAIPVILVSAAADVEEHASRLGVFGYFRKPVDFAALLQTIRVATNVSPAPVDFSYGEAPVASGDGPPVSFAIA